MTTLGIDIGATKMLGCLLDDDGSIEAETTIPTPESSAGIVDAVVELARVLSPRSAPPLGLSVAGWVDRSRRIITFSPHLSWRDEPLARAVEDRLDTPVTLENDANAAAWAEYRFGAGRGCTDLLLVTVGSGIGSGIVCDGRLLRGANGMAGEMGHTTFERGGPRCPCGRRGCVDMFGSGRALARAFGEVSDRTATGVEVGALALSGDVSAIGSLDRIAQAVASGIAETVMILDPDVVVLGGGASTLGEALRHPVEQHLLASLGRHFDPSRVSVRVAETGPRAGALGVGDLARPAKVTA